MAVSARKKEMVVNAYHLFSNSAWRINSSYKGFCTRAIYLCYFLKTGIDLMYKKSFPVFLLLLTLISKTSIVFSQENGVLRGVIKDSLSLEVLPFANVLIKELGTGVSTNVRGYFVIPSISSGKKYSVQVSFVGYQSKTKSVLIESGKITELEILLNPTTIQMQAIEKIERIREEKNLPDIGKAVITPRELEVMPKGVETDILRSLTYMPGVQSTGDVSAKFNVRGGESNQNLILIDGVPIYYPFHSIGLFSVVDPDIVHNIDFYKGGFPADYGRAISSVLNITTKEGNKNRIQARMSASLLSAKAMVEGPLPEGSFYLTARKSVSNEVLKKFVSNNDLPIDFYDASFKLNFSNPGFFNGTKFSLHGLFSEDNLNYDESFRPDYRWVNKIIGLNMFVVGEDPFFLDMNISFSNYLNKIDAKASTIKPKENELTDFTIQTNFTYVLDSKDEIGLGLDFKAITSKLYLENRFGFRADTGLERIGSNAHINYKFLRFSNIGIDLGVRLNLKNMNANGDIAEPRINVNWIVQPQLSLKGAFGIYQQDLTTISDEREVLSLFDPVVIIPDYLPKPKAIHYLLGTSASLSENISIQVEGYYKNIITAPTLNELKTVFSEPDILEYKGESYGAEFQFKYTSLYFDLNTSYSLSWAFKEVNGYRYSPRYDSRHNLNTSLIIKLPGSWTLSTTWLYHSGFPFTQQVGYYEKINLDDLVMDYLLFNSLSPIVFFDQKNLMRLPDYHRLDLSLSKKFDFSFMKLNLDISAINVYDRKNIFYFEQDSGKRVNMLPFLLTGTIKVEL